MARAAQKHPRGYVRAEVARRLALGERPIDIAASLGVTRQHVSQVMHYDRHRARGIARCAILKGSLVPAGACSRCGTTGKVDAHHWDYSKPLDITWFCEPCHYEVDAERRRAERFQRKFEVAFGIFQEIFG